MSLPKFNKFSLKIKLLVLFILVSSIPLILGDVLWYKTSRDQILKVTSDQLSSTTSDQAHYLENYLSLKETSLIIYSQTDSILNFDIPKATTNLHSLMLQDSDVIQATLIDKNGKEILKMNRDRVFSPGELVDQSQSAAFKVPTYVGGEVYISPVYFDQNGKPEIYISVPIVNPGNAQNLSNLTTSSVGLPRTPGEILGILKVDYNLDNPWHEITTFKTSANGYTFLVDDKGNVLAHPLPLYRGGKKNLSSVSEVNNFLVSLQSPQVGNSLVSESKNESGQLSLMSYSRVNPTNWGIISEIPLSDTFAETNQVNYYAIILLIISIGLVTLVSFWISGRIIQPIKLLQIGADYLGRGQLSYRLDIKTGDEIEVLAQRFNEMALSLTRSIDQISAERNKSEIILSGITDAVIAVDLSGSIITFNRATENLTGYSAKDVLGKPLNQVLRLFDRKEEISPSIYCPIRTDGFEGIVYSKKDLKLFGGQNKTATVNLITGQIKEGARVNLGAILTFHDISTENQLEEMKLDFVSMAAHELRTPLTSLKGYLYILLRDYKDKFDPKELTITTRISVATQRLVSLVENLLNVTRIERGALTVHLEPIDWVSNIQSTIAEIIDQAKDKKLELVFETPPDLPTLMIDKLRVNEVLTNLLSNAIAYTQPGGHIRVWIDKTSDHIITHVKDNGEGIPPEALPHLFTKFFRVSGRLEQGSKGTGLGLYIAKSIIEMHNGKIWAESEGLGKGSTFSFSLPIHNGQQPQTHS